MPKSKYFIRYALIVQYIDKHPYCPAQDILYHVSNHFEKYEDEKINYSLRTLQRDLNEIRNELKLFIEFDKMEKGYVISKKDSHFSYINKLLEITDMVVLNGMMNRYADVIFVADRKNDAQFQYAAEILEAIKNHQILHIHYQKYWEEGTTKTHIQPYALKEFNHRWYLIGIDTIDHKLKSYGLERLISLQNSKMLFKKDETINIQKYYEHCFGIVSPNASEPTEIILEFIENQGLYIKSKPLHHSQHILSDTPKSLIISIKVFITFDFIKEILSFGHRCRVLSPPLVVNQIKTVFEKSLSLYL